MRSSSGLLGCLTSTAAERWLVNTIVPGGMSSWLVWLVLMGLCSAVLEEPPEEQAVTLYAAASTAANQQRWAEARSHLPQLKALLASGELSALRAAQVAQGVDTITDYLLKHGQLTPPATPPTPQGTVPAPDLLCSKLGLAGNTVCLREARTALETAARPAENDAERARALDL